MNTSVNTVRIIKEREKTIGNTTFIITSEQSENATETIEQKLERIIRRHASDIKMAENKSFNVPKSTL